ncbi:MAG: serine/threonine protein kinase [Peptococcaceae bacterium]|nr:serine/threonine protein kinase [Peptococcaceae bacterium]
MGKFSEILSEILGNTETDNQYSILEVLKEGDYSRVEKVSKNGKVYVRKYYQEGQHTIGDLPRLSHAFLPQMFDSYRLADQIVIIEEYIEGLTLYDHVKQNKVLSLQEAVSLTLDLCEVVSYLHTQNPPIIHRDIKPNNIIYANNSIKLIDFNIARTYSPGKESDTVYMGTVGYAPPEQFGFGQTDMRSDIFSIGKTFLYMITGSQPQRHIDTTTLGVFPEIVQRIIYLSTNFTPQFRYNSVDDMIKDLRSAEDAAIRYDNAVQAFVPSSIDLNFPSQSDPDQQTPTQKDVTSEPEFATEMKMSTQSDTVNARLGAWSLQITNETNILTSGPLPAESPMHDESYPDQEDIPEYIPENIPENIPEDSHEKPPKTRKKSRMKTQRLILLLAVACCVLLTIGLGVFFILNGQSSANALAEADAQSFEPDPDAEWQPGLESEPAAGSEEDSDANSEAAPEFTLELEEKPEQNIKPEQVNNSAPEQIQQQSQSSAPAIEIVSTPAPNVDYQYSSSTNQYRAVVTYTVITNVSADKLEVQNVGIIKSDGSKNSTFSSYSVSSDKKTWTFDGFYYIEGKGSSTETISVRVYDAKGNVSAWKSISVNLSR